MDIPEVESPPYIDELDVDDPNVHRVGEGVFDLGVFIFDATRWHHYGITLADEFNGTDWRDTVITVSITLGGGRGGRDHWGWPGEGFAPVMHGRVGDTGIFDHMIADVGTSPVLGAVWRWIRRGQHGATGRTWHARSGFVT